jgi:hypothetical protein
MKMKPFKRCKLSFCKKLLILCEKPVNGCCNLSHFRIWKKEYNANYYEQKKEVVLNAKYLDMLGSCLRQFGEDVPFNAEILDNMGFDWKFSNEQIDVGGFLYDVIGEYAFAGVTINKIKKIKIIKINRYE